MYRTRLFLGLLVGLSVILPLKVYAQDVMAPISYSGSMSSSSMSSSSTNLTTVNTNNFTGRLLKVDSNNYTVQSGNDTKTFNLVNNNQLLVTKNGVKSQLSDIQINDQVTIQYDDNNNIIKIDGITASIIDYGKIALVAIIVIALAIVLAALLLRGRNQSHIKTQTTQI